MIKHFFSIFILCLSLGAMAQNEDYKFHEVKAGETLYSLSKQYDVSIERLKKFNPDLKEGLRAGMKLLIPSPEKNADTPATPTPSASSGDADTNFVAHTVKDDQTLYSIARTYGVEMSDIRKANPQMGEVIKLGQVLRIPLHKKKQREREEEQTPAEMLKNYYVIKIEPKQTAYSISKQFDISLDSIYTLNPGAEDGLQIGQFLKLPKNRQPEDEAIVQKELEPKEQLNRDVPTPKPQLPLDEDIEGYLLYQIKTGDSFYSLKQRYNVSREELIRINPEVASGLEVGKYVIIPQEEERKEETFFDKLFRKIEETDENLGKPNQRQVNRRDSLNRGADLPAEDKRPDVDTDTIPANYQKNYLVGVMLPFMTMGDSLAGEISPVQKMSMEFYQGLSMAADSLSNAGMNLTLNVYDTRNSREKLSRDIDRIRRTNFDLVIGPLYKSNVEFMADNLMRDSVPVISPLSRTVDVQNRPNLINVLPGSEATAENTAKILDKFFMDSRIVFAHEGDEESRVLVRQIKARLQPRDSGNFLDKALSVEGESVEMEELEAAMAEGRQNVVVILSENKVFLSSLVNSLRQLRDYKIKAVGPSRLLEVPTLDLQYLNDMQLTMTDMHYVNYQDSATIDFIREYRDKFEAEPSRYAFQGYDVGMYFFNKLWKSGSYFMISIEDNQSMLSTGFDIRKSKGGGYENDFLFTTGVREYTLLKLKDQSGQDQTEKENAGEDKRSGQSEMGRR